MRGEVLLRLENSGPENEQSKRHKTYEMVRSRGKEEREMGRGMEMRSSGGKGVVGDASCRRQHLLRLLINSSFSMSAMRTETANIPEGLRYSSAGSPGQLSTSLNSAHSGRSAWPRHNAGLTWDGWIIPKDGNHGVTGGG